MTSRQRNRTYTNICEKLQEISKMTLPVLHLRMDAEPQAKPLWV